MTTKQAPRIVSAIYKAAEYIRDNGPQSVEALFAAVDFGARGDRTGKLNYSFETGWLEKTPMNSIGLTNFAREHFEDKRPKKKYVGQVTPAKYQADIFASPGLSPRFIPNRRGPRADAPPAYGDKPSFHRG
jgi:hypothetical protein